MSRTYRWGILGPGRIAHQFAADLQLLPEAELVAVGSRSRENAEAFGAQYHIPHRHASYEALAADPEVEIIYVATPHIFHYRDSLLCLQHGKAVLCEKAFTINAREAEQLIAFARREKLFLMEAMWTRFQPALIKLRELLAAGTIGEQRMLRGELAFRAPFDPSGRLFDPALGGGALLDLGIYPLALAAMIFGAAPTDIRGVAHIGATGVDEQCAFMLQYPEGQLASLFAAVRTAAPGGAVLLGSEGRIEIHGPLYRPESLTVIPEGREPQIFPTPYGGHGYLYEAREVMHCLAAGKTESETMPLDESLALMRIMDTLRRQWNLRYPTE